MGDLRTAMDLVAALADYRRYAGPNHESRAVEVQVEAVTADRLAIVEWLREYIDRDGCDTDDLLAIPDRLEAAIKRAGGGEL